MSSVEHWVGLLCLLQYVASIPLRGKLSCYVWLLFTVILIHSYTLYYVCTSSITLDREWVLRGYREMYITWSSIMLWLLESWYSVWTSQSSFHFPFVVCVMPWLLRYLPSCGRDIDVCFLMGLSPRKIRYNRSAVIHFSCMHCFWLRSGLIPNPKRDV